MSNPYDSVIADTPPVPRPMPRRGEVDEVGMIDVGIPTLATARRKRKQKRDARSDSAHSSAAAFKAAAQRFAPMKPYQANLDGLRATFAKWRRENGWDHEVESQMIDLYFSTRARSCPWSTPFWKDFILWAPRHCEHVLGQARQTAAYMQANPEAADRFAEMWKRQEENMARIKAENAARRAAEEAAACTTPA